MTQYIGKPSKVHAVCFDEENKAKIETLFAQEIAAKKLEIDWGEKEYAIHADWGTIGGSKGDWIVLYKPGDIASCKADAFGSYMPGDEKDAYLKPGKAFEAEQWRGNEESFETIKRLNPKCVEAIRSARGKIVGVKLLTIDSNGMASGAVTVKRIGDYVKRGPLGEVYPNDEETFIAKNLNGDRTPIEPIGRKKAS
jgi:hypothetical protein